MTQYEVFAEQLLRSGDPVAAARAIGLDGPTALLAARDWPNKLEVIEAKQQLIEAHGAEYFLPSKFDQARDVWNRAKGTNDPDAYAKLMRLYAEIQGNIAPKNEQKLSIDAPKIIFEMVMPAPVKPVIDVTPERLLIEKP